MCGYVILFLVFYGVYTMFKKTSWTLEFDASLMFI